MELGLYTFAETTPDEAGTGVTPPPERMRELVEEAVLAEQVGLDVFGVGEHHRRDLIVSSPAVVLGAIASRTSRIRLTSAVTVLSSDDPVRVFQDFATLDLLSSGRAEIMAGRGSFTESFPLFGFDLSINGHGHVAETTARAADEYWPGHERSMRKLGVERGWPPPTRAQYDALIGPRGALLVGDPETVAEKILLQHRIFENTRYLIYLMGMPHRTVMHAIELLGTRVVPIVRAGLEQEQRAKVSSA